MSRFGAQTSELRAYIRVLMCARTAQHIAKINVSLGVGRFDIEYIRTEFSQHTEGIAANASVGGGGGSQDSISSTETNKHKKMYQQTRVEYA